MKLPIEHEFFEMIRADERTSVYERDRITFVDMETGEELLMRVFSIYIVEKP